MAGTSTNVPRGLYPSSFQVQTQETTDGMKTSEETLFSLVPFRPQLTLTRKFPCYAGEEARSPKALPQAFRGQLFQFRTTLFTGFNRGFDELSTENEQYPEELALSPSEVYTYPDPEITNNANMARNSAYPGSVPMQYASSSSKKKISSADRDTLARRPAVAKAFAQPKPSTSNAPSAVPHATTQSSSQSQRLDGVIPKEVEKQVAQPKGIRITNTTLSKEAQAFHHRGRAPSSLYAIPKTTSIQLASTSSKKAQSLRN
ncbi:hypothetical protein M7I_7812 [Glarea lozoyensis 74030]|uniref:Uncharacterized protein n=1 Tax=Glarea lozoyensis (strain ATCC 74030 / MF5533) TaxID=1104152 RepID=H0EYB3_GLAL7|nr:hypothetical protein M7I_7812 [Glarea lozoyensis 74030]